MNHQESLFSGAASLETESERVGQCVPRLAQYVQREIAYYLATGELGADLVRVEDVVDEAVVRALTEKQTRPPALAFDRWLISLAGDILNKQVQQLQVRREAAGREEQRVEQKLSRLPPERTVSAVEDEMYAWYQPDERMHLEDIVADPYTKSPEEIRANRQLRRNLDRLIAFLPKPWRDVFVLSTIEGFTVDEISIVMEQTPDQVRQALESARHFLRERLSARRVGSTDQNRAAGGA